MKFRGLILAVLALAVGGLLLSGCCFPSGLSNKIGDEVGKSVEKGVKKSIEDKTGVKVESGDSAEASGTDLKSVPKYTGAKRTFYIKGEPVNGNISVSITYQTSDTPAKVSAFYKEKMAALGWTVTMTVAGQDGGEMVTYDKGDNNTTATVNITKGSDKTEITVMYNGTEAGA